MSAELNVFVNAQGGESRAELDVNISAPHENVLHVEITVLPDLSGYATKAYVDEAVRGGAGGITELPIASADTLGGVRVGKNLRIDQSGVLDVDTTDEVEADNTRPITSAAVHETVGNINALLGTI